MSTTKHEFCVVCGEDRTIRHEQQRVAYDVRGDTLEFDLRVRVCETCGTVEERDGLDLAAMAFAEYRRRRGLLAPEEIKAIRQRYKLSQRSLAALLGMSEATINRYEGGGLQNDAHDQAIRCCANPEVMRDLLQRRGERLSVRQRTRVEQSLGGISESPRTAFKNRLSRFYSREPGAPAFIMQCNWPSQQWPHDDPTIRLTKAVVH